MSLKKYLPGPESYRELRETAPPQVLEDNSEHFRAFCLEKHFSKANEPKKAPKCISGPKGFRTIFEKQAPVYSLAALLLVLAKSIY